MLPFAISCALCLSCSKEGESEQKAAASATIDGADAPVPSASVEARPSGARSGFGSFAAERAARRAKLETPPLKPPEDALEAGAGVRWQLLRNGHENPIDDHDALSADVTVWKMDGSRATSTFDRDYAGSIKLSSVSAEFRELIQRLKAPAVARYWIPKVAHSSWRPESWPDEDVIVQVDVYTVARSDQPLGIKAPKPAASGPPETAKTAANGYRYQVLERGAEQQLAEKEPFTLVWSAWAIEGLVVRRVNKNERTASTLQKVPGGLAPIVRDMQIGETRRVWVPKTKAAEISPDAKGVNLVVDLLVQQ